MVDFIVIAVIVAIIGGVAWYLYRQKKKGNRCVGCPYTKQCSGKCNQKEDA